MRASCPSGVGRRCLPRPRSGGMLIPAAVYLALAGGVSTRSGWGVPMATDIAFALGILTLLGERVPAALRVLLLALAVIDDLGAIVVIALFYSSGIALKGSGGRRARIRSRVRDAAARRPFARSLTSFPQSSRGQACTRPASIRRSPA